jgi:hypothetical protein
VLAEALQGLVAALDGVVLLLHRVPFLGGRVKYPLDLPLSRPEEELNRSSEG